MDTFISRFMSAINFLPPPLTEAWAAAYLQILIGLFVFALGIPVLAFQLIVQDDVKHVAQHRMRVRGWLVSTLALFAGSILFVWLLHPMQARDQITLAQLYPNGTAYLAALIVTFTPSLAAWFGIRLISGHRRAAVIKRLAGDLKKSFARQGYFESTVFDDLIYLGEHGKAGEEKEMVLAIVENLARDIQRRDDYQGCELEDLIRSIEMILCGECKGDDRNYCHAVNIMKEIWKTLTKPEQKMHSDASATLHVLKSLSLAAVIHKSEQTALEYLEEDALCDSNIVFEVGFAALSAKRFFIATAALNKLEALAADQTALTRATQDELAEWLKKNEPALAKGNEAIMDEMEHRQGTLSEQLEVNNEVTANLLGLLSHFRGSGLSASKRAEISLSQNGDAFLAPLTDSLKSAFTYHFNRGQYDTSDRIAEFKVLGGSWVET
jgi:hypothetical protein